MWQLLAWDCGKHGSNPSNSARNGWYRGALGLAHVQLLAWLVLIDCCIWTWSRQASWNWKKLGRYLSERFDMFKIFLIKHSWVQDMFCLQPCSISCQHATHIDNPYLSTCPCLTFGDLCLAKDLIPTTSHPWFTLTHFPSSFCWPISS